MISLTAVIIDDEFHGRKNLDNLLKNYCPEINVIGLASNVLEAKELIYVKSPEVVFLDINMPKVSGFEFLESMPNKNFNIVIVSAHDFGIKAVNYNADGYLLKPIDIIEMQRIVKRLIEKKVSETKQSSSKTTESKKIVIKNLTGFKVINSDDIIRLEAMNNYTTFYLVDGQKEISSKTLKEFEKLMTGDNFIRVHKSAIINLEYVKSFSTKDGSQLIMADDSLVEVSRRKLPEFIQKLNSLNKKQD